MGLEHILFELAHIHVFVHITSDIFIIHLDHMHIFSYL